MRGFPVNGDPKPAELSRPSEKPPPELGYRCAQGRRLDLVDKRIRGAVRARMATFTQLHSANRRAHSFPESHCNLSDATPCSARYVSRGSHITTLIGVGLKSLQGLLIWGQLEMTKSTSMSKVMST
jgi:hypothetical protein